MFATKRRKWFVLQMYHGGRCFGVAGNQIPSFPTTFHRINDTRLTPSITTNTLPFCSGTDGGLCMFVLQPFGVPLCHVKNVRHPHDRGCFFFSRPEYKVHVGFTVGGFRQWVFVGTVCCSFCDNTVEYSMRVFHLEQFYAN